MTTQIEKADRLRTVLVYVAIAGALVLLINGIRIDFALAFASPRDNVPWGLLQNLPIRGNHLDTILNYVSTIAVATCFLMLLVGGSAYGVRVGADAALRTSVRDEIVRQRWLIAFRAGFVILLTLLVACTAYKAAVELRYGSQQGPQVPRVAALGWYLLERHPVGIALLVLLCKFQFTGRSRAG